MGDQIKMKYSKEFQIKLRKQKGNTHKKSVKTIQRVLSKLNDDGLLYFDPDSGNHWQRRGERYDTKKSNFKRLNISLATEKSKIKETERTKLKCKLHNFVPELLYTSSKKASCYPGNGGNNKIKTKFKREQDIHFDNCKYCATGYLDLPSLKPSFQKAKDFYTYYPNLEKACGVKPSTQLKKVKDWDEYIFDDLKIRVGSTEIKGALVTRINRGDSSWDETEFSFKIQQQQDSKQPDGGWDFDDLNHLATIYQRLFTEYSRTFFIRTPSIFYFNNPVSSQEVKPVTGNGK